MNEHSPQSHGAEDITVLAIHSLARLLSGMTVEIGESGMAPRWKDLVVNLSVSPVGDVGAELDRRLASMQDVDAEQLLSAIFNCDPRQPLPVTNGSTLTPSTFPIASLYIDEKRETGSLRLQTVTLAKLLSRPNTQINWTVEGLIPAGGVAIVAAPAGYGKSWTLLDLAIECARGGRWMGRFSVTKGGVLYLDEESAESLLIHRLKKLLAGKEIPGEDLDITFGIGQGICFNDASSFAVIKDAVARAKPSLIIIDSLIRVHRAEENSATEMARMFANVKTLVREFDCTVVFADHQKKPGNLGSSLDMLLRGSTEKAAFVDVLLSMQRKDDVLIVEHSKSRYTEPVAPFVIRIEDPFLDATIVRCVGDAEEMLQSARLDEAVAFLRNALSPGDWVARKVLVSDAKKVGISQRLLGGSLRLMEKGGSIVHENRRPAQGRGGRQHFYKLAPTDNDGQPEDTLETGD